MDRRLKCRGKAPVCDRYPLSDHPTLTQSYIFKVEYHHVTTLHTHCFHNVNPCVFRIILCCCSISIMQGWVEVGRSLTGCRSLTGDFIRDMRNGSKAGERTLPGLRQYKSYITDLYIVNNSIAFLISFKFDTSTIKEQIPIDLDNYYAIIKLFHMHGSNITPYFTLKNM